RNQSIPYSNSSCQDALVDRGGMFFSVLLLVQQSILQTSGEKFRDTGYEKLMDEQALINRLISRESDYDYRVRPRGTLNPISSDATAVDVHANMYLRSISKVDDVNMEYSLHFTFREEWVDERLYFNSPILQHIVLSPEQKIWVPDTFFQNEKDGKKHMIDKPNVLIRVYNGTGRILYSCRLTLTLSCPMRLVDYPLDVQTCFIDFASYAYTTKDIEYHWKDSKPIQIKDGIRESLPSFILSDVRTNSCTSVTNTGVYSCLRTEIELKREFSYYLLQLYIPSFMLVAVSWVSFWLDKDSVPARVTLGVTTLLTMTTQASGVNANLPPVSYTKAIDIWIGVCLAFIFGALLEFALVNWAARQDIVRNQYRTRHQTNMLYRLQSEANNHSAYNGHHYTALPMEPPRMNNNGHSMVIRQVVLSCNHLLSNPIALTQMGTARVGLSWWGSLWQVKYREHSRRIDLISRVIFPLFFVIFNITYWLRYLVPYLEVETKTL
ncbi:hypothetical protein PRIPAC_83908, partial [Pristionchus pacificus]|uniref:Transmembrane ion channel n=1 Tax=Pristionchus pacificus TaxID=54126 RepID=A0A2A6C9H5_PRIPA